MHVAMCWSVLLCFLFVWQLNCGKIHTLFFLNSTDSDRSVQVWAGRHGFKLILWYFSTQLRDLILFKYVTASYFCLFMLNFLYFLSQSCVFALVSTLVWTVWQCERTLKLKKIICLRVSWSEARSATLLTRYCTFVDSLHTCNSPVWAFKMKEFAAGISLLLLLLPAFIVSNCLAAITLTYIIHNIRASLLQFVPASAIREESAHSAPSKHDEIKVYPTWKQIETLFWYEHLERNNFVLHVVIIVWGMNIRYQV